MKNLTILGVTGSIGTQALQVINNQREDFRLIAISAHSNYKLVIEIIEKFKPSYVAITDEEAFDKIKNYCSNISMDIQVLKGIEGLIEISTLPEVDMVLTSVVGMIGLIPTVKAIESGKDIAIANKETLVVGGELIIPLAKKHNVKLLPVDSEHCAIFQCLQGNSPKDIHKIIVTASGGPFRGKTKDQLSNVTLEEALNHPRWSMGKKISVDSATLMNKGLEVIEAHWLFNMPFENIDVIVHPQSIIHSMVEYTDGSIIAQLGNTDMKLPIQYALNYPKREIALAPRLDFAEIGKLTFEQPDYNTFSCLKLAYSAGKASKLYPTILNAANEEAVSLFLHESISFLKIAEIIEECLNKFDGNKEVTINNILEMESSVREFIKRIH